MWRRGHYDTEIMRPEFDAGGHDLVITANGVTRHIQLKATILSSKRANWDASERLATRSSGCLIVLHIDEKNLKIRRFGLFAGPPGHPLPDITSYRATRYRKGDSKAPKVARKDRRTVPKGKFDVYEEVAGLYDALFGPEPPDTR